MHWAHGVATAIILSTALGLHTTLSYDICKCHSIKYSEDDGFHQPLLAHMSVSAARNLPKYDTTRSEA